MFSFLRRCYTGPYFQQSRLFHDTRLQKEDSRWQGWQVIIGIETHAQIKSRRKLFSESYTSDLREPPNTHVSNFDAAFPGSLPILNHQCVDIALRTAMALGCDIQNHSSFDRKHYFYYDLPHGYQITQHYAPIARGGSLSITLPGSPTFPVRIKQIQLEQDTAKSTFVPRTLTSNIDLNRAGTGLMEIVSEPDLRSPEEAAAYVRGIQAVLRAVGSSDGNMEQGSLRCDVNVSINRIGDPPGTRCEIKNLNSVRFMTAAIICEIHRQREILESASCLQNGTVPQETRGFDEHRFETFSLRSKEDAPDYRYMPDPNLGTLVLTENRLQKIRAALPELPWEARTRLKASYGLPERDVEVLMNIDSGRKVYHDGELGKSAVAFFDQLCAGHGIIGDRKREPRVVFNWVTHELLGQLTLRKETFNDLQMSAEQLGQLIDLVQDKIITGTSGKYLLRHILEKQLRTSPIKLAQELNLLALRKITPTATSSSEDEVHDLCAAAVAALPEETKAVQSGHKNVLNKILGRVMRESRGRIDAKTARDLLEMLILRQQR